MRGRATEALCLTTCGECHLCNGKTCTYLLCYARNMSIDTLRLHIKDVVIQIGGNIAVIMCEKLAIA